ncbi:hypothetical protein [Aidingimonas lacisalsi]|uniref:hypothetical protein n=1 Tax=Aidingimonas lacisalsi TaxID=2604086 RepID=UPI0011D19AFE|nr:hypothetical protein [Aidingimonas lacisalsi]
MRTLIMHGAGKGSTLPDALMPSILPEAGYRLGVVEDPTASEMIDFVFFLKRTLDYLRVRP